MKLEDGENVAVPGARDFLNVEGGGGSMPVAEDGGPMPGYSQGGAPTPEWTPETVPCARECRYYLEIKSHFDAGNVEGEFSQFNRYCGAVSGALIDLTDDVVKDCNRWLPHDPRQLAGIEKIREAYFKRHPEHRPDRELDDGDAIGDDDDSEATE